MYLRVAAFFALSLTLLSLACNRSASPAAPSPASSLGGPADFSGIWQGQYQVTTCSGERHCEMTIGTTKPLVLRLTQSGARVTGLVQAWSFVVDVTGEVSKEGVLSLSGRRDGIGGGLEGIGSVDLPTVKVRRDLQAGLTGEISYTVAPPPGAATDSGFWTVSHTGTILNGTHAALDPAPPSTITAYEGSWSGQYAVEACVFAGWAGCYPEEGNGVYTFKLDLQADGTTLVGQLVLASASMDVTASLKAGSLVVEGSASRPVSGGTDIIRLQACSVTRDVYGRLNGSFSYERLFNRAIGSPNSSTYQGRLLGVVRQP